MKEQTYFHIPTPCHENWDNMTPEGKGRFCASCSKQVVDFSLMSDNEVLNHFTKSSGRVCGRFADDQLQRPMVPAAQLKKKTWWIAALMPLLLLFEKAGAQKKNIQTVKGRTIAICKPIPQIMGITIPRKIIEPQPLPTNVHSNKIIGDTVLTKIKRELVIKGTLTDRETGKPLPYASVILKGSNTGTAADENGCFKLSLKDSTAVPTLIISYVGYESKEIDLNTENAGISISINVNGLLKEVNIKPELTK